MYIGDNQFIHASKEKGVTISSLTNDYWRARYLAARRVV
ncbi:NlpC/P60 family protein [Vibrio parahaemolyticus]